MGSYGYVYPGWPYYPYAYPYVIDPGFYDWSVPNDSGDGQAGAAANYAPYADYGGTFDAGPQAPYYPPGAYAQQPYEQAPMPSGARPGYPVTSSAAPVAEEPLTLIFKNGRASQTIRNYMMDSKTLTVMDAQHYERIPLDQIDVAATIQTNRLRGINFTVPAGVGE